VPWQPGNAIRPSFFTTREALGRLERHAEALKEWDRALDSDTWPDRSEYRLQRALMLARLGEHGKAVEEANFLAQGKNLPGATLFALARVYARAAGADPDHGARALDLLNQAETAGYFAVAANRDQLKTSADLGPIRSSEGFVELTGRVEQR
jgi:hypothetical protein